LSYLHFGIGQTSRYWPLDYSNPGMIHLNNEIIFATVWKFFFKVLSLFWLRWYFIIWLNVVSVPVKKIWSGLGQINFLWLGFGMGWVSHLWFGSGFGKFPLKMSIFFPSGKKNLFGSGQKVPRSKAGQPLIYCGSKVSKYFVNLTSWISVSQFVLLSFLIFFWKEHLYIIISVAIHKARIYLIQHRCGSLKV